MRCPVCLDTELVEHIREGVETDHCPRCQGIWLDRGELEKVLDLAEARSPEPRIVTPERERRMPEPLPHDRRKDEDDHERYGDRYERDRYDDRKGGRKRKRKSPFAEMLEEVFDVFD